MQKIDKDGKAGWFYLRKMFGKNNNTRLWQYVDHRHVKNESQPKSTWVFHEILSERFSSWKFLVMWECLPLQQSPALFYVTHQYVHHVKNENLTGDSASILKDFDKFLGFYNENTINLVNKLTKISIDAGNFREATELTQRLVKMYECIFLKFKLNILAGNFSWFCSRVSTLLAHSRFTRGWIFNFQNKYYIFMNFSVIFSGQVDASRRRLQPRKSAQCTEESTRHTVHLTRTLTPARSRTRRHHGGNCRREELPTKKMNLKLAQNHL